MSENDKDKRRAALGRVQGWAPGQYMGRCRTCEVRLESADKRAYQCFECAAISEIEYLRASSVRPEIEASLNAIAEATVSDMREQLRKVLSGAFVAAPTELS